MIERKVEKFTKIHWKYTEFPMLCENWTTFSITENKYFLRLQSKFFVRLKAVSHSISQNLEAIDHAVPEIKNYNYRHGIFARIHLNIIAKLHAVIQEKVENKDMYFYNCHRWSFPRILTQMIKYLLIHIWSSAYHSLNTALHTIIYTGVSI